VVRFFSPSHHGASGRMLVKKEMLENLASGPLGLRHFSGFPFQIYISFLSTKIFQIFDIFQTKKLFDAHSRGD
jgi:hypothetical protein